MSAAAQPGAGREHPEGPRAIEHLQDWVSLEAAGRPEAIAVVMGDEALSYGGLEALSNRLARLLAAAGCGRGDRVALLAPKSPRAIAGVLAVYKAGAILVPLDPASPAPRLAKILRSSAAGWLLAGPGAGQRLAELAPLLAREADRSAAPRLGWLAADELPGGGPGFETVFSAADLAAVSAEPPDPRTTSADPAHLLFTSGSTGEPKGVVIPHEPVIRFVRWAVRHFGIERGERLSGHPPLHFDLSYFDLFGAFAAGAELHLIPPEANLLPHRFAEVVRRSRLTQLFAVPSALAYMARFDAVEQDDFPALRRLLWCGEIFPTPDLVHWMTRLPHVAFTNLYGPTETTIASSFYDVASVPEELAAAIPIGGARACDGEDLLVLDDRLRPLPPGETGDLYVAGAGLSPGYWRDPARTAAAFLPAPDAAGVSAPEAGARIYRTGDLAERRASGDVSFLGRADAQVKSRGYRIELGEIENALAAVGLVREAVVTAIASEGFEGQLICCAYVPARNGGGELAGAAALRRELARSLPAYMIPARWLEWERLPRNANGKLDRTRVAEAARQQERNRHAALAASGSGSR